MTKIQTRTTRRTTKPIYEPVLKLPPLRYEDFVALRDNIAVNGVLVPILVDSDGPRRNIIDGNYRKQIAEELGYDCPEIVHPNLEEDEKRTLARALNLARRQFTQEQKRELIADQLEETPNRSNRWVAKQLGVHHATVGAVRGEMQSTGQIIQLDRTVGLDGRATVVQQICTGHRPFDCRTSFEDRRHEVDPRRLREGTQEESPQPASTPSSAIRRTPKSNENTDACRRRSGTP